MLNQLKKGDNMSWAEIKKAVNSNLAKPLDALIGEKTIEIKDILNDTGYGLSVIKNILTDSTNGLNAIKSYISNSTYGLSAIKDILANSTYGLIAIKSILTDSTNGLSAIKSYVSNSTYGLSAIKSAITTMSTTISSSAGYTPSTAAARAAFVAKGHTLKRTDTVMGISVYVYYTSAKIKDTTWDEANALCQMYAELVNKWSQENGYGKICIGSRLPTYNEQIYASSGATWTGTQYGSNSNHYYWAGSSCGNGTDYTASGVVPVVLII